MSRTRPLILSLGAVAALVSLGSDPDQPERPFPPPSAADSERRVVTNTWTAPAPAAEEAVDDAAYRLDEIIVAFAPGADPAEIVAEQGGRILDATPELGLALVEVPADRTPADFRAQLAADARVTAAAPNAVVAGAKKGNGNSSKRQRKKDDSGSTSSTTDGATDSSDSTTSAPESGSSGSSTQSGASELQWYRDWIGVEGAVPTGISRVTVAVLDSGVAYTSDRVRGTNYAVPEGLQGVTFVSPKDFVDRDEQPLDEHQHGTHIASLIGAGGDFPGVAPGVQIMPVRVLDADNRGTEYGLIQGILWATAQGADVINMSLAFAPGYVPSAQLRQALDDAAARGVVLVAAAGNDARDDVPSWPAASPSVISVGASSLKAGDLGPEEIGAPYSNLGVGIDIMAPGGDLHTDINGDGVPDGMVAETIRPGDPSETAPWMFAGSSQAAALVSGAAARMLAAGVPPQDVRLSMLEGSRYWGNNSFRKGLGAGSVDVDRALEFDSAAWVQDPPRFGASLLAYPTEGIDLDGNAYARAEALMSVELLGGTSSTSQVELFGTMWGPNGAETWTCKVKLSEGTCLVKGDAVAISQLGDDPAASWAFSIEAVIETRIEVPHRPAAMMYASDAFEIVLAAIEDNNKVRNRALAVEWTGAEDPVLGPTARGYTVMNSGTGLATSPFGVVFTPGALEMSNPRTEDLDLDGTGLATSPMGLMPVTRFNIDGTGLATSPFGFRELQLVAIDGTGLATSPMGFTARDLFSPLGTAPSHGMGFDGGLMLLQDATIVGASASTAGSSSEGLLGSGGYATDDGFQLADVLVGSGAAEVGLSVSSAAVAAGDDAMALP